MKRTRWSPGLCALLAMILFGIAVTTLVYSVDRGVSPTYISSVLRRGMSMQDVGSRLPASLQIKRYSGPWPYWVLNEDGSGFSVFGPPEITLEFDEKGRLYHAYFSVEIDERVQSIPLSQ